MRDMIIEIFEVAIITSPGFRIQARAPAAGRRAPGFLTLIWCGRRYACVCVCVCVCLCVRPPGY